MLTASGRPDHKRTWRQHSATLYLLLALCLAPMLSRMHQALHVPAVLALVGAAAYPVAYPAATPATTEASPLAGAVQALFAHHHGALDCQALDQLAHGQAPLYAPAWPLCHPQEEAASRPLAAGIPAFTPRWFEARAPPQCPVPVRA